MRRILTFLILLFCKLVASDSEDINPFDITLSAECQPLTTVAGCVNVLSGDFFQVENDLVGNTVDPISICRYYDSSSKHESFYGIGFGSQFPLFASEAQRGKKHFYVMISERDGFLLPYKGDLKIHSKVNRTCFIDPRVLEKGYTNCNMAKIRGETNFVNWEAVFQPFPYGSWIVTLGNGTKRIYGKSYLLCKEAQSEMDFPTDRLYVLTEEIKPNGNKLKYQYELQQEKPILTNVQTINRSDIKINELSLKHSKTQCIAESSCGLIVLCQQQNELDYLIKRGIKFPLKKKRLNEIISTQNGKTTFHVKPNIYKAFPPIAKVEKASGHYLEVKYNQFNQVKEVVEPLGPNQEPVCTYSFHYYPNKTEVFDAYQSGTTYHFDQNKRLSLIDFGPRIVKFVWSVHGWLRTKIIKAGDQIFHATAYQYDQNGNVIKEIFYGNLTGEKTLTFSVKEKDLTDTYSIEYKYSNDGFNLLLEKRTPEGLIIHYSYLPQTNLCTKELQAYDGKIQERTFRHYDDNGELQKLVVDDGSGQEENDLTDVTFRKIKLIEPILDPGASFGKPHFVSNYSQMQFLNKTEYFYDAFGNEILQKIYDSQGNFCYEISKQYDERQRLSLKTNAMDHQTCFKYDENNNIIEEELIGSARKFSYEYDTRNRIKSKKEIHENGEIFETTYTYDALNNLLCEKDAYGHETNYVYDRFGNEQECQKPAIQDQDGNPIRPKTAKAYNAFDQMDAFTNENGFTTHYERNVYGKPTKITHPDGSIEKFTYYPSGWLKQHWKTDNSSIQYAYDPKGRLISKKTLDPSGGLLKQEEYPYKGPLLMSSKDANGIITSYRYNGSGQKIEENVANLKITKYTYDDFGRLRTIVNGDQIEKMAYDWLDHIIEKALQDSTGKLYGKEKYTYDIQGNCIEKSTWHAENKVATYKWSYRPDGLLNWLENPLGHRTTKHYNHHHHNGIDQQVQSREIMDAMGRITKEADDTHSRLVRRDLYENGEPCSCVHYDYDAEGNVVKQNARVIFEGKMLREYGVKRTYNNVGLLETETEIHNGKTITYRYNSLKQLIQKEQPAGIAVEYEYDFLGRLKKLTSADQTISYTYAYDLMDNPIEVIDHVHNIVLTRKYNTLNQLIRESIDGLTTEFEYDAHDRLIKMTLPDNSSVVYLYDAYHLKKVQRYKASQEIDYECVCMDYDWLGNPLSIYCPAGIRRYAYDLLGRAINIQAYEWEGKAEKFDPVGNLISLNQNQKTQNFEYDRFNQLIKEPGKQYAYDCIGNCLRLNGKNLDVNDLNQLKADETCHYQYDVNGNLIYQSAPEITYTYDALNRLIKMSKKGVESTFIYDAFGRCLKIVENKQVKQLIYQGEQEIGSFREGEFHEFKLIDPKITQERTYAIEIEGEAYFPVQDNRHNICMLKDRQDETVKTIDYSAFGKIGEQGSVDNPWQYANRREVEGLIMFTHRFYNPQMMRWLTQDPARFVDGLNLYSYLHNNPYVYYDRDGRFVFAIPIVISLVSGTFGVGGVTIATLTMGQVVGAVAGAAIGAALGTYAYNSCKSDHRYNNEAVAPHKEQDEEEDQKKKKENFKFPENPDDLLPDLPRDKDGNIQVADNIRIRPEKHTLNEGKEYNPRHHGQHYQIETRYNPSGKWKSENVEIIKPENYIKGKGTGFIPGEFFPGI